MALLFVRSVPRLNSPIAHLAAIDLTRRLALLGRAEQDLSRVCLVGRHSTSQAANILIPAIVKGLDFSPVRSAMRR